MGERVKNNVVSISSEADPTLPSPSFRSPSFEILLRAQVPTQLVQRFPILQTIRKEIVFGTIKVFETLGKTRQTSQVVLGTAKSVQVFGKGG